MACKTSFELHHHFPKIAEESGFAFNTHRPRVHIDWNKIRLIDVENLIRERKFVLIEQHLNDILDCVLESEFDVRILDEGVLKLFRLAQLSVEYQQFCRHYLDRSVFILRQEINSMAQELESTKKSLQEKEEELRKLKRRTRHTYKTPLPYGNDNIANMILKTLSNRNDLFQSTSNLDTHQYNRCKYCEKVFLNQLYLKSHIERRHADVMELPQKEVETDANQKLSNEIMELRTKLRDMEQIIATTNKQAAPPPLISSEISNNNTKTATDISQSPKNTQNINLKNFKDAEVSTNNDEYFINKLEEWKKEEQEKHNKEISQLRNEILETINSFKIKDDPSPTKTDSNSDIMEQLHTTIKQQGAEIFTLKEELRISKVITEKENSDRNKEAESKIAFWIQKAETQAKQYESLLQKLNDVAKDAKESRTLAEAERERASKLEALIEKSLNHKVKENTAIVNPPVPTAVQKPNTNGFMKNPVQDHSPKKMEKPYNRDTLENLHKRAQELLNTNSISSTTSDISSSENVQPIPMKDEILPEKSPQKKNVYKHNNIKNKSPNKEEINLTRTQSQSDTDVNKLSKKKEQKLKKNKSKLLTRVTKEVKTSVYIPESPMKVVRAKITEEVNNRLVLVGVDPLKSRLSQNVFRKQRAQLQQQHELKSKKNANFDKVRNSILSYLDENTASVKSEINHNVDYISPTKSSKPLRSLTSVIANVKTKALSLVKGNDTNLKAKRKSLSAEVSKRAMELLKTPTGSVSTSPQHERSPIKENTKELMTKPNKESVISNKVNHNKPPPQITQKNDVSDDSEDETDESDHKYYNTSVVQLSSKSTMETLLKSPARRPASANLEDNYTFTRYPIHHNENHLIRTQSATHLNKVNSETKMSKSSQPIQPNSSSDEMETLPEAPLKRANSEEIVQDKKQTKGVLKNASSTSSLNKKKVLFDMDAIQMKSVSASPSQSITEKSDVDKYELGLVNLDTEEWDISSIENEPLKNDIKLRFPTRTTPKIAELKKTIESQLARRNETPSTALVGSVDVLGGTLHKAASIGGSNTSLGSSILDESESVPKINHKAQKLSAKDDSDLDISELIIQDVDVKNESF